MFSRIQADQVGRPHHVAVPDIRLGGNLVCFHLQMLHNYVGLADTGKLKLTVKEEHGSDELLCFVIEGGYFQAWSIASFANFWFSIIIIMTILKKLHIAPDKLHECSTITELISHCVLQKLLPTISFKRLLSLEICSQT